ncbi:MAG: hypothetical protein ABJE10_19110 [bacterium]
MTTSQLFKSTLALPAPVPDTAPQQLCASDHPLVLLPVRLETRFFTLANAAMELRVRVYPDKIHLDSHEKDLRPTEITAGQRYWQQDWAAGANMDARATAWRQLADNFGAARAAFVARTLTPTNPAGRSATPQAAPVFPTVTVATLDIPWRSAPTARLLPDRWIAALHCGDGTVTKVTSKDIKQGLHVGPDPLVSDADILGNAAVAAGTELATDPGMKWMIDFIEAETVGMGFRIPLTQAMITAGLDNLYVFGVSGTLSASSASTQLADLLDAHHYTDGLEFLRHGTPTNNTDDRRVTSSEDDPSHLQSFGIEVNTDPATLDSGSNAVCVAAALGISPSRLTYIARSAEHHEPDTQSMNTALWPATWGYFLTNMLGPETAGLTPAVVDWARTHFKTSVRGGGPFPILRTGRQPYGLLPVTSLDLWKPKVGDETIQANDVKLQGLLIKLRDVTWRTALVRVARLGSRGSVPGTTPDVDADLADVMRVDAVSGRYNVESLFGPHYLAHLRAFFNEDLNVKGFNSGLDLFTNSVLKQLGLALQPRLRHATLSGQIFPMTSALVQIGEVAPWAPLQPNYIKDLLDLTKIDDIVNARTDPNTNTLLKALLRHALLREIADSVARMAAGTNATTLAALLRDVELIDLVRDPADPSGLTVVKTATWKRQLANTGSITGGQTIQTYLEGAVDYTKSEVAPLGELRASMAHLKDLDSERLQYLMQGTLDLSSHRLDAWMTSFATKRLAAMTPSGSQGAYVGAYGWVENIIPLPGVAVPPPSGEQAPIFTLPNDTGFIHAPSHTHAEAAALLRNAQLGAANVPQPNSPFAIDLSSRRVREASRLLDGVREGQPLGALLGYRMERRLHELALDHFIAGLRSLAPVAPSTLPNGTAPAQTIAANNVVDGQLLFRRWNEDKANVLATLNGISKVATEITQVTTELDKLGDAIDGVSDALVAETAYQVVRGNNSRIAAALAAIAKGDAPPPELEVARMPRTGTALTHRVLVHFSGNPAPLPNWFAAGNSYRGGFEPQLNAWVSKLLGDPKLVRCTIDRLDDVTGAVVETRKFPLSDVPLAPMDFVFGVEEATGAVPTGAPNETEQLILYFSKHNTGGFAVNANLRLQHARPTDLTPGEVTLFDLLEQARAIRKMLASARASEPEDVNPPERDTKVTFDLVELLARVTRLEGTLLSVNNQLNGAIARKPTTCEDIRTALLRAGLLGIGPFVPIVASGETPQALAALQRQGTALLKTIAARAAKGTELRLQPDAIDPRARRDQLIERIKAVFGGSCFILPTFVFDAAAATEFTKAIAASTATQGGDALAVNTWFTRSARVRDAVSRLGGCLRTAEVLNAGARLDLKVVQLPLVTGERWVGLPPLPNVPLPHSKLSLVVHSPLAINTAGRQSGLVIDEWSEVVPNNTETTALTFQYNPPDASAPQAVLLAVPPIPENPWTVESLHRVLIETFDLAKLRGVQPDVLGAVSHYLPGVYLAFNAKDETVSTDVASLTIAPTVPPPLPAYGVSITTPRGGNVAFGQSVVVSGIYANAFVDNAIITQISVDVQFGTGGPTAHIELDPRNFFGGAWECVGQPFATVTAGQSFTITATITGSYESLSFPGQFVPLDTLQDVVTLTVV